MKARSENGRLLFREFARNYVEHYQKDTVLYPGFLLGKRYDSAYARFEPYCTLKRNTRNGFSIQLSNITVSAEELFGIELRRHFTELPKFSALSCELTLPPGDHKATSAAAKAAGCDEVTVREWYENGILSLQFSLSLSHLHTRALPVDCTLYKQVFLVQKIITI